LTNIFFNIYQYYEPKIKFNNNLTNIIIKIGKNENKNFLDIQNINHIDSFDMINNIDTIINYKNITEDYYSKILNKKYLSIYNEEHLIIDNLYKNCALGGYFSNMIENNEELYNHYEGID